MRSAVIVIATLLVACGSPVKVTHDTDTDGEDTTTDTGEDVPADSVTDSEPDTAPDTPTDPVPDGMEDEDTDGDTILDVDEGRWDSGGPPDTDGDGTPDYEDTDSDGDGLLDADEAGDDDVHTPPDDCDGDGRPNYRDRDSDDDGLTDTRETELGTDVCDEDSDGDGYSDLIEDAYDSDPLDEDDNPGVYGDFTFLVPYDDDPSPTADTLVFSTDLKVGDVYFLVDHTASLMDEISALISEFSSVVIPGIRAEIADAWFGVGAFQDCGSTYCANGMARLQEMTSDTTLVSTAISGMSSGLCGGYEPYPQAIYATASGDVAPFAAWSNVHPRTWTCTAPGSIGWPCFRETAVPIIVQIGDEPFADAMNPSRCSPAMDHTDAIDAINDIEGKYIGINSGEGTYSSHADMVTVATGTGSVDSTTGDPLVFDIPSDGSGLGTQIVDAVSSVATAVPIRVDAIAHDDPSDMVDAVAMFISEIHTNTTGSSIWDPILGEMRTCTSGLAVGTPGTAPTTDYFEVVDPGISVCFDIVPRRNTTVTPTSIPVFFRATIEVVGDEHTPLDEREVLFLVPPVIPGG
jgi:hypothetical protein